jgi:DNA-binding GntR family transcriptional regulator
MTMNTQHSSLQRTGDSSVTVYRHLFDAILEQRLQPGSRLAEDKLGGIFGVSRTVIRTALQRLAGEGVVVMRPNRGAAVATPDVDEARQVLDARRVVELAVVERLCGHLGDAAIERLNFLIELEREKVAGNDRGGAIRVSGEFHLALAEAAGNEPLTGFLRGLISRTSLIISQYQQTGLPACAEDAHRGLVDRLLAGDLAAARETMRRHLDDIEGRLDLTPPSVEDTDLEQTFAHLSHK